MTEVIFLFKRLLVLGIALSTIVLTFTCFNLKNEKEVLSRYGSRGNEVTQIQTKLKNWGYYNGSVDGVYGSRTLSAVKRFQSRNGLSADGIAGPATLAAMGIQSSSSASAGSDSNNLNLLARIIHGEARGEPYNGMVAVGAVVLNRVSNPNFPSTVAGVIYQKGAFDAVSDGQINLAPSTQSYNAARDALNGWDPTGGAIYYFNPVTATNKWIWSRPHAITIGKHRFCM